jgi:mono/diheme cytochrome c family protein
MRNFSLIFKQFSKTVLLVAGFAILGFSAKAQGDATKGEALFKANCTSCHAIEKQVIGPALGPLVTEDTDDKWLTKWIENNQALLSAKDQKALKIYNQFNQQGMSVFAQFSDGDVANILAYIRADWADQKKKLASTPTTTTTAADNGPSNIMVFALIGVIIVAFIVILVLNRVIGTLEKVVLRANDLAPEEEEIETKPAVDRMALARKLVKNKKLVFFVVVCGTIACGSWTWVTLWNTNVHQGYQPEQPIHFPHDLHAGVMKIDCQYCHSGAYKSKNASIPSLNICMNCHKVVKTESPEIHKIYDALGYDPKTQRYDTTKAHPMQWIRVHNLPDLVYFNHSQHVKVGQIRCQTCHGPIQTMKEVYQYSPLTMKWCIQCHKRTEVNYKGNAYYDNMIAVHERIKRGEKVTAASLGGIECGKCHY